MTLRRDSGRALAWTGYPPDDRARAARLSSIVKFAGHLASLESEDDIILAFLQAAAVWYDLDARAYRIESDGLFHVRTTLPGANRSDSPSVLTECPTHPTRLASLAELHRLGWRNPSATVLLLPISIAAQPRWIVSVTGAVEGDAETELGSLSAILSTLFDRLTLRQTDNLHARLRGTLTAQTGSPNETAAALLTELARAVSAVQAGFWLRTDDDRAAQIAVVGAPSFPAPSFTDPRPMLSPDRILLPVPSHGTAIGALELRAAPDVPFTAEHVSLASAGAGDVQFWLQGLRGGGVIEHSGTLNGAAFEIRLREEIERAKRFGLPIGLIVFAIPGASSSRQISDISETLLRELRNQLRACDIVGSLDQGDLAVMFTHTDARGLSAAIGRLSERLGPISRRSDFPGFRIGQALYPSHAESASELLIQARLSARQPAGSIM